MGFVGESRFRCDQSPAELWASGYNFYIENTGGPPRSARTMVAAYHTGKAIRVDRRAAFPLR